LFFYVIVILTLCKWWSNGY